MVRAAAPRYDGHHRPLLEHDRRPGEKVRCRHPVATGQPARLPEALRRPAGVREGDPGAGNPGSLVLIEGEVIG